MKKMIVILAVAMVMSAASAFAISTTSAAAPSNLKGFNKTNKVNVYYLGNAASTAWASVSAHEAGDKEYWTSSAYGGVAFKTVTPGSTNGTTATGAPSTPTDSSLASGYTSM
jgi:hypothetical protein